MKKPKDAEDSSGEDEEDDEEVETVVLQFKLKQRVASIPVNKRWTKGQLRSLARNVLDPNKPMDKKRAVILLTSGKSYDESFDDLSGRSSDEEEEEDSAEGSDENEDDGSDAL